MTQDASNGVSGSKSALNTSRMVASESPDEQNLVEHEQVAELNPPRQVKGTPWPSDRKLVSIPISDIQAKVPLRDPSAYHEGEMREMMASLKHMGLAKPIVVSAGPKDDRYTLIQGSRRLTAFRRLFDETGQDLWSRIPAFVVQSDVDVVQLYRQMIDENLVQKSISYAELACIALAFLEGIADRDTSLDNVIDQLFGSASQSKRDDIKLFVRLLEYLDRVLLYPSEITLPLGRALVRQIEDFPSVVQMIRRDLRDWTNRSVIDELSVLRSYADACAYDLPDALRPELQGKGLPLRRKLPRRSSQRQSLLTPTGRADYVVADDSVNVRFNRMIAACDTETFENALRHFVAQISQRTTERRDESTPPRTRDEQT